MPNGETGCTKVAFSLKCEDSLSVPNTAVEAGSAGQWSMIMNCAIQGHVVTPVVCYI